jgi:hypothetical protein
VRMRNARFLAVEVGLERARVKLEQQIALVHNCPLLERRLFDKSTHPCVNDGRLGDERYPLY